jgi:hypothetical protein
LSEQINAQNDKLKDMEMTVNEKNLQLSNSEDLLSRVSIDVATSLIAVE